MDEVLQSSAQTGRAAAEGARKSLKIRFFDYSFASKAIYGAIAVMAVIVAMEAHPPTALFAAAQSFGVTLAVAVAETYAEIIAHTLDIERKVNKEEWREVWRKVSPVLFGAQAPTLVFLLSAGGLFSVETAIAVSKVLVLALLFVYGFETARFLHKERFVQILSGLVIMSAGAVIVLINYLFH
jgi:hypothetical protein